MINLGITFKSTVNLFINFGQSKLTVTANFSSFGVSMYGSSPSQPDTLQKQLEVWPIPVGNILSSNMALTTVLLPLLVRPKKHTYHKNERLMQKNQSAFCKLYKN